MNLRNTLKCNAKEILVNSTGVIGQHLPDDKIISALPGLLEQATPGGGLSNAMSAIMTTDTRPKMAQVRIEYEGRTLHVSGIAKGAGMIHPNMATMIATILTDAEAEPKELDRALASLQSSAAFHRISIDGDTSTNDAVFALASGRAGRFPSELLEQAMAAVARELALMVVRDGEGAQKLIHVRVLEARSQPEALQIAQTVASSLLVRTAITGGDPNWGRILAAIGRSGVNVDLAKIRILANDVPLFSGGGPADSPLADRQAAFRAQTVVLSIHLDQGSASDEFFTCDLTEGYIQVNSHYMT